MQRTRQEKTGHIRASDEEQEDRGDACKLKEVEDLLPVGRDTQRAAANRFKPHSLKNECEAVAFIAGDHAATGDLRHNRRQRSARCLRLSRVAQPANKSVIWV